jgi:hypothetical protein
VLTLSLSSLPALKRTVLLALIVMASPVAGLRPLREPRSATPKLPKAGTLADSPAFSASVIAENTASKAAVACLRVMPSTESTMLFTKSALPAISLLLQSFF